jgi:hypothetical protein
MQLLKEYQNNFFLAWSSENIAGSATSAPACLSDILFKMATKVSYHARRLYVHIVSAFLPVDVVVACWGGANEISISAIYDFFHAIKS